MVAKLINGKTITQIVFQAIEENPWSTCFELMEKLPQLEYQQIATVLSSESRDEKGKLKRRKSDKVSGNKKRLYQYALKEENEVVKTSFIPDKIVKEIREEIREERKEKKLEEVKEKDSSLEILADAFGDALADRIMLRLKKKLSQQIQDFIPILPKSSNPEAFLSELIQDAKEEKVDKKNVLIIGLLPQQAGIIQNEFGKDLNIRFWKDENPKQLKEIAKTSEFVITFTSKIGHWVEDILKSENRIPIRVSGGMTMLKDKLTEIYVGM